MSNPWDPDRTLTMETAADAIAACFPGIEARDLKFLGSGWEFDAWLTRDNWVVRFPRRAGIDTLLVPEWRVHQLVRSALPPGVEVPLVEHGWLHNAFRASANCHLKPRESHATRTP